jgi:epoxide hydrolase-like predicted phosphatase
MTTLMDQFKAIVFDFGGVLELNESGNLMKRIAESLSVPVDEFRKIYHKHNHLTNVRNIPWEDVAVEVARTFDKSPEAEKHVREIVRAHRASNVINTELLGLFSALRKAGFKVAILSNNTTSLRARLDEKGITPLLDEVVISAEIGHQKPHKEAFDFVFKKLGVRPEEVIFVDDSPKSLERASEIGYQPILFKNNEQLKADLKKLGIPV